MERKPRGRNCAAESEGLTLLLCRGVNRRGAPTLQQERDPSSEHPVVRELWVGRSSGAPPFLGIKGRRVGTTGVKAQVTGLFLWGREKGRVSADGGLLWKSAFQPLSGSLDR